MSRDLDSTLAAALANGSIMPIILAALDFASGTSYVWSGIGDLPWNGNIFKGVGALGKVSPISEGSSVKADGMSVGLSGLTLAGFVNADAPAGITPPRTPAAGEFIVWAEAASGAETHYSGDGTVAGGRDFCTITRTQHVLGDTIGNQFTWTGFSAVLPADAVITDLYLVAVVEATGGAGLTGFTLPSIPFSSQQLTGAALSPATVEELESISVAANMAWSAPTPPADVSLSVSSLRIAVYYTSASSNAVSSINEILSDVQLGASAQIWFGLLANGALLGVPYLVFSGAIDQPTIKLSADTIDISLALENRLSNLQRANQRRYTAADQHLAYPDDIAFNWVEIMNDIALRWGG